MPPRTRKTTAAATGAPPVENTADQTPTQTAQSTAPDPAYVTALLRERAGYVRRGLTDRAAAVTAELKAVGAPADDGA